MIASGVIRSLGKRVSFEPRIMVPSATSSTLPSLLEFLRRQFFMARHYSPKLWALIVVGWTLVVAAFWFNAALAVWGAATGAPRWWLPAALTAACYVLGTARSKLRTDACRECLPEHAEQLRAAQRVDLWAWPVASLLGWLGLIGSALGHRCTWRNIRYHLDRRGKVRSVTHLQDPGQSAADSRRAA